MTEREQSERALIGCVLAQPDLALELKAEWFDDLRLAGLLAAAAKMLNEGKPIDRRTLANESKDVPDAAQIISEAEQECHSAANFSYWKAIVVEGFEKTRLNRAVLKFQSQIPSANGNLRTIISELENALSKPISNESRTLSPKECALGLNSHLEARFNLQGKRSGLETGFSKLDYYTDGLQFGEFTILAARPSVGKTAIACNLVDKICLIGKVPTLVLSLEMSAASLCRRLLSCHEKVTMQSLKSGNLTEEDFVKVSAFDRTLKNSPLYIREAFGGMGAGEAAALIRRGAARKGIKLVVLDYLQKLKPDSRHEKRTYEVAEASGAMVDAVRESGVAFLCLAQLSRESEKDKGRVPRISDLADSGQIERDADNVLLLHRDRNKDLHDAKIIVGKQRDGETGVVPLYFEGQYCQFTTAEIKQPEPHHSDK